jgi:hypothetical protein
MRKRNVDEMLVEAAKRHLLFPSGMELELSGNDLLLLAFGCAIAKRENGKWVVLEPGWSDWLRFEVETVLHVEGRS